MTVEVGVRRNPSRWIVPVIVAAVALAACSSKGNEQAGEGTTTSVKPTPAKAAALSWNTPAAVQFNGDLPSADPTRVCGANDRRFLGELLAGNPLAFKIPKRLGEVKPVPSQAVISGTVTEASVGEGDFPFDHTMGSDFNMDVQLDAPFMGIGQENAKPIDHVHVELAEGQLPHVPTPPGPATQDWTAMSKASREGFQKGFVPKTGDRVLVMGTWIVDCGHQNFQTELHPATFMAVARTEGDATVVHTFYNPYRETQLYNADPAKTTDFSRPGRLEDPTNVPFPKGLVDSIIRVTKGEPATGSDAKGLASWAVMAPNTVAPVEWTVCPPGSPSGTPKVGAELVVRTGAKVAVAPQGGCASVRVDLSGMTPAEPTMRTCVTRWDFLSEVASEEARGQEREGETAIDLRKEIGKFVPADIAKKLEPDPVMNCYDPLSGKDLGGARPGTVNSSVSASTQMPFYGTVVVRGGR
ncbi:MAG: hypothetical protein ACKOYM_10420 [Actinomycetes bacterium]